MCYVYANYIDLCSSTESFYFVHYMRYLMISKFYFQLKNYKSPPLKGSLWFDSFCMWSFALKLMWLLLSIVSAVLNKLFSISLILLVKILSPTAHINCVLHWIMFCHPFGLIFLWFFFIKLLKKPKQNSKPTSKSTNKKPNPPYFSKSCFPTSSDKF